MEEENFGYFSISRKLTESPLWLSEKFTKAQAWVDLISLARYEENDSYFYVRGIKVNVSIGQLAFTESKLADRWKWSRNKVRAFLATLEKMGNIEQQKNNVITLISIVNYIKYQKKVQQTEQQKNNRKTTKGTHNNKENKENKGNKNTIYKPGNFKSKISGEISFSLNQNVFLCKVRKSRKKRRKFLHVRKYQTLVIGFHDYMVKNNPELMKSVKINLKGSCKIIDELIRIDNYGLNEIRKILFFACKDSFWKSKVLSIASLRDKGKNGQMKFKNIHASYLQNIQEQNKPTTENNEKVVYSKPIENELV